MVLGLVFFLLFLSPTDRLQYFYLEFAKLACLYCPDKVTASQIQESIYKPNLPSHYRTELLITGERRQYAHFKLEDTFHPCCDAVIPT